MINDSVRVTLAGDTIVTIQSESSDWPVDWTNIPKRFFVSVVTDGESVPDVTVSLQSDNPDISLNLINTPVTDQNGVAECLVLFEGGVENVQFGVIASAGEGSSNDAVSPALVIELVRTELSPPRIPEAIDGVIDDADYNSGVVVNVIAANMSVGDSVYLLWGSDELQETVTEAGTGVFAFVLSGPDNEHLFQNQHYDVRCYVVDATGNGRYSSSVNILVDRINGGGGLAYYPPVVIQEAEQTGFINKAMSDYGVTALIQNASFTYTDGDGIEHTINHALNNATACSLSLQGMNNSGVNVISQKFQLDLSTLVPNANLVTARGVIPASFFNTIGSGQVRVKCFVAADGVNFSISDADQKVYYVDVVPPGRM